MTEPFTRDSFSRFVQVPVRWGDMDALGHVNNAVFLSYFEMARIHFFEAIGMDHYWTDEVGPILKTVSAVFEAQVKYPSILEIGTRALPPRNSSFLLKYAAFDAATKQLVAHGDSVVVWVNMIAGTALALPDGLRQQIC